MKMVRERTEISLNIPFCVVLTFEHINIPQVQKIKLNPKGKEANPKPIQQQQKIYLYIKLKNLKKGLPWWSSG